jgi:hypothetical protein
MASQIVIQQRIKYKNTFLVSEFILDFILLCINGFFLKWRLTFGDKAHEHPHVSDERSIWLINSYLNIIFAALSVDLFFPILYLLVKNSNFLLFYFTTTFVLLGASFGMILPIEEELNIDSSLLFRQYLIPFYTLLSILLVLRITFIFYYKRNYLQI